MPTIDDWLQSEETGAAFTHCVACRFPLLEIAAPWLVNKEFAGGECVMEYAVCQPCRDGVSARLSEESKEAVRKFLVTEIDWSARIQDAVLQADTAARFERCFACRTPRGEVPGFGISALFAPDGELIEDALPLMICNGCIARMTAVLSAESRAVWQRFVADHFVGPPDDPPFGMFG